MFLNLERHNQNRNQVSDQERAQQRIEDMKTTARTWVYTGDLQKAIDCFTEVWTMMLKDDGPAYVN